MEGRPISDLEDLFSETFADVWRFARRRTTSSADADDVTAEIFATACRRHPDIPPAGERRLWIFGVARHVLANHSRGVARRQKLGVRLNSLRQDTSIDQEPLLDDCHLWAALARLPAEDRELLIMRAWDGLAVTEIAALLDVTPNAASVRLSRARKKLSGLLAQTGADRGGHEPDDPAPTRGRHGNG
jgi:RNA polymerase sigma-70 factor (ECF subfamily)